MNSSEIETFKVLKALRELGWVEPTGEIKSEVKESCRRILEFLAIAVAIPAIAACVTVLALAFGSASVLLLWWLLFI